MSEPTCSIDDCTVPARRRGWCNRHYQRWYKHGDPLFVTRKPPPISASVGTARCGIEWCSQLVQSRGWCQKHYKHWKKTGSPHDVAIIVGDDEARLWSKVDKGAPEECWPWTGPTKRSRGYGILSRAGQQGQTSHAAHRFAYELLVGPIPPGLEIDHVCHDPAVCKLTDDCPHRRCCNPAHLKPATCRDNTLRSNAASAKNAVKTHCPQDHEYDEENTYWHRNKRYCRKCRREQDRRWRARRQLTAASA
jgi:hypothetical protein